MIVHRPYLDNDLFVFHHSALLSSDKAKTLFMTQLRCFVLLARDDKRKTPI
jgi:hypothetical protein